MKIWYLLGNLDVDRKYLIALLTAEKHGRDVPAYASSKFYRDLLGWDPPKRRPRRKRKLDAVDDDSWEIGAVAKPAKRSRPATAAGAKRERRRESEPPSPGASTFSMPPSSSRRSNSSISSKAASADGPPPAPGLDASPRPPSASPARSARSARSLGSLVSIAPSAFSGHSMRMRSYGTSFPFARSRLTPRYDKGSAQITGYQCYCFNTNHVGCTKTLSNTVSGSEEMTLRMLKMWALLGANTACIKDKQAHKIAWEQVEEARRCGWILPMEDLDMMQAFSSEGGASGSADASTSKLPKIDAAPAPAAPGTPPGVQARLQAMIDAGQIPATTEAQRRRNQKAKGSRYGVPDGLKEALNYAYISPMLPPPRGLRWAVRRPGTWSLVPVGG